MATATIGARPLTLRRSVSPLLVTALVVATGWSVLAGGWSDSTGGVLLIGLAGVVEGLVLARWRTPRAIALAASPVLLLVSLLPSNAASRPVSPGTGLGHIIGQYATAAVTGLLGNAQWEFNVALGALLWVCGAWAAWFAVREKRGAIATGPCWAVIAVNVINAPSTSGVTLPAALASGAALLLIAAVHLDRLSDSWRQRRVSVLPGTGGRFATAALFGGALIVLLALVIPPLSSTDISGRLFGGANKGTTGHGGHSGAGSGSGGATVRFSSATIPGGALSLSDTPVLSYTSSLSTGVYLRMETDSVFDTGNFLPAQSANNNGDDTQEILDPPGVISRDRTAADGGVGVQHAPVSLTVRMIDDSSDTNTLPFAGEPDAASVAARVNGLTGPDLNGQLLTIDSVESLHSLIGTSFTTTATDSAASADQLRRASSTYPGFVTRDFLDLTDDSTHGAAAIHALAVQWTRTATNAYDKATLIESTLRNPQLFHYTLSPPTPPPVKTIWPVTYFLTVTHAGYCQYYAAAMGAMLRSLGIPSRLVNGYGPGTAPNAATRRTTAEDSWNVSSNDAHTWVEAYFPPYGWIPFEPTPPSQAGDYQPFGRGALGAVGVPGSGTTPVATPRALTSTPNAQAALGTAASPSGGGRTALMSVAGFVVALLLMTTVFAAWFLRPRNIRGVWRRVGIIGRLLGVPRDRALTFGEYVDHLTAALPGAGSAAWPQRLGAGLRDIAVISDRTFYSLSTQAPDQDNLKRSWRRVALLAPRLSRRPARPHAAP
ncbi:MAG: transglutaminase-like domain-containing protein [Candidatus Dormibacteraeota bacterium]|nr:transglutaminase-like domain-containing protein [Candidatus Dormibacteraeota bacterium]